MKNTNEPMTNQNLQFQPPDDRGIARLGDADPVVEEVHPGWVAQDVVHGSDGEAAATSRGSKICSHVANIR